MQEWLGWATVENARLNGSIQDGDRLRQSASPRMRRRAVQAAAARVVSLVTDDLVLHHRPQLDARQEVVHPRREVMVGHLLVQEAHNSMFLVLARCHSKHHEPLRQS